VFLRFKSKKTASTLATSIYSMLLAAGFDPFLFLPTKGSSKLTAAILCPGYILSDGTVKQQDY
jgi:hypothetical protein